VDNTEATAALQSSPLSVIRADRDQMGHKCPPKLQGWVHPGKHPEELVLRSPGLGDLLDI